MSQTSVDTIRNCLEGIIPSFLATCDGDGVPNISEISQVQYVDPERVALSYQFFNKTRRNILATRQAAVIVVDPDTNAQYRLYLDYEETRTEGPLFEAMRAKLAGIASHEGMQGIFKLLGADVFRVSEIETVRFEALPPACRVNLLAAARRTCEALAGAADLGALFDRLLEALLEHLGVEHSIVLMFDESGQRLFTVASRGYPESGVGSEIGLGEGVIGVAAAQGVPIRIGRMTSEYSYSAAIRDSARRSGVELMPSTEIPYPGLDAPLSQIAMPIRYCDRTLGVLFAESRRPNMFRYDEEDALAVILAQVSAHVAMLQTEPGPDSAPAAPVAAISHGPHLRVRHFAADNSVFLDQDYLIKGVAGAIFWRILTDYVKHGRTEITNRELRLDPSLRLPQYSENLEARLLLLQRRLTEKSPLIRLERCGRGRLRLEVAATVELEAIA